MYKIYVDGLKSPWPSLAYVKLGISDCLVGNWTGALSPPHYEYDEAFLIAAHGSTGIGSNIWVMKSSRPSLKLM